MNNSPVNYNDPTGHMCSDPEDPTPTCDSGSPSGKLKPAINDKYYKSADVPLTRLGGETYYWYLWAKNNKGWWNNGSIGTMTIQQFIGIFILWEASGNRGYRMYGIRDAVGYQIFMEARKNGYKDKVVNSPYCPGNKCFNGVFNFIGRYSYGIKPDGQILDYVATRFGNLNSHNHPVFSDSLYDDDNPEDLATLGKKLGDRIYADEAKYRAGDPYGDIPYHWGNPVGPFIFTNLSGKEVTPVVLP